MDFKTMFPELNQNQINMLVRVIEDEVIGADVDVPRPLDEESRARFYRKSGQNFLRHTQRTTLTNLIKPTKD